MNLRILLLPFVALALAFSVAVDAGPGKKEKGPKLYKWVDKNGVTHFGNAIPPEYASQGGEQINKQGETVKVIEAEKTGAELEALQRERTAAAEAKKDAAEQEQHDRMLIGTYATLTDLQRAHEAKVSSIQSQVQLASGTVANLERELLRLEKAERKEKEAGNPVPDKLARNIAKHRSELLANQRFIFEKQTEIDAANAQYENDRQRLIKLKGLKD
jgi:hypothetical protein